MRSTLQKQLRGNRRRRKQRVRAVVAGSASRPRLSVFRSNKHITVQLIDDQTHVTLLTVSDKDVKATTPIETAKAVGTLVASQAKEKKITAAVFDRSGYHYHGRVRAVAEGAREGGLQI